jgi:hypothetical protein
MTDIHQLHTAAIGVSGRASARDGNGMQHMWHRAFVTEDDL